MNDKNLKKSFFLQTYLELLEIALKELVKYCLFTMYLYLAYTMHAWK